MIFYIIFVIIVLLILYAFIANSIQSSNEVVYLHNAKTEMKVSSGKLKKSKLTSDYAWSMWIYVNNWNYRYGEKKVILSRKSPEGVPCPEIYLAKNKNDLVVNIGEERGQQNAGTYECGDVGTKCCKVNNIPMQKWVHIVVTTNTRSVDIYLDGKLVRTCLLDHPPKLSSSSDVVLCPGNEDGGGFSGFVSKLEYYPKTLNPREVYDLYISGNSSAFGNLANKFGFKFSFLKDNEEIGTFKL